MRHGPVGIRCEECLRAPRAELKLARPERQGLVLSITVSQAVVWCVLLIWAAWGTRNISPNIFLSAVAGGSLGFFAWLIGGRVCNRITLRLSIGLAAGAPLVAALILLCLYPSFLSDWHVYLRATVAAGIAALIAWIAATRDW
jgi:hypothetical protein